MPSDPLVLGFDTSAAHCAAALICGPNTLALRSAQMARGQAEQLMPLLIECLDEAEVTWSDLCRIGVGIGPGNFTGIRIAVSAARGLALGLGIPAIGVDLFESSAHLSGQGLICVPAMRGQVYMRDIDAVSTPEILAKAPQGALVSSQYSPTEHAIAIARIAGGKSAGVAPAPFYVRAADAAPSRDLPPALLDGA